MPDKLTDSEIKKALDICSKSTNGCSHSDYTCEDCYLNGQPMCSAVLMQDALDLINRLQAEKEQYKANSDSRQTNECENIDVVRFEAEIDRQKAEIERLKANLNIEFEKFASEYDNKIKAEAYKECIEKVIETALLIEKNAFQGCYVISKGNLDNLLKELVGDK